MPNAFTARHIIDRHVAAVTILQSAIVIVFVQDA